ncbi:MAG: hypothetical protein JO340_04345, partial [Acidobacteriaceae bacterium]|nr:hypothetical protein [Acidobacteriaceae bacterium]
MSLRKLGRQPALGLAVLLAAALPVIGGWKLTGPFGGSARALAIDPQNGRTLVAGSRDSLLFRSDDAGASWRLLPFPRGTPGEFHSILIDPQISTHYYAGLDAGESQDSGVYESDDAGETWRILAGLRGSRIESLAMAAGNSSTLAAGTSKGVFLSIDRGTTWRRISSPSDVEMQDITALTFDPADTNTLYAGTPHLPWKTTDGGATWHSISRGLIDDSDIFSIRVDPKNSQLMFASACSGIYRSDTAGEAWVKIQGIPGTHRRTHIIAEDPRNSDTIFAGTTLGLFKSPDGGKTWRHLSFEQVNWMVFDPSDPRTLYLATEFAGILKSTDSGETFRPTNAGFANHRLSAITSDGKHLYASSTYESLFGGVFVSDDGGLQWSLRANEEALHGRNVESLVASPNNADIVLAASEDAILKSTDGGKTWVAVSMPAPAAPRAAQRANSAARVRINALRVVQMEGEDVDRDKHDRDKPERNKADGRKQDKSKLFLFAGTDAGLFRSSNFGVTWEQEKAPEILGVPILAMYVPVSGASRLIVRTASGLLVSEDVGRTWQPAPIPEGYYLYDVAAPVEHDAAILVATSRGVLRSMDEGSHWKLVTEGIPAATVDSIRFNPFERGEAFLVQFGNIYRTVDGGESWKPFSNDGLEGAGV